MVQAWAGSFLWVPFMYGVTSQSGGALGHLGWGFRLVLLGGEVWLRILMEEWLVSLLYVWEVV